MRCNRFAISVVVATALLPAAVSAGDAANPLLSPTVVELAIRGPNGRSVADADVLLFSGDEHVAAKTDATGLARFAWPYPAPIFVRVPGVGYGATGLFPLRAGKTVRVPLPRLAPFGVVEGAVPKSLVKRGMVVSNGGVDWAPEPGGTMRMGSSEWLRTEAAVADDGHFVLKDVPAGDCWLHADAKHGELPTAETDVFVDPGEAIKNIVLEKSPPRTAIARPDSKEQKADEPKPEAPPPEKEPEPVVWAEGTVRDEAGRSLEGAQVFASVLQQGGIMYSEFGAAISDGHGHWQIAGPPWNFVVKAQLLVCKFGYCSAVVPIRIPELADVSQTAVAIADSKPRPTLPLKPQVLDVALLAHCGGMEVLVTRDGKPLADAMVSVAEDAPEELLLGAASEAVAWEDAAERILHPISVTGSDGIARFNDLTPGSYAILVDDHLPDPRFIWQLWERGADGRFTGSWPPYHGVVVESGKARRFHALLGPAGYSVSLRLTNPDGKPAASLAITRGFAGQGGETTDANGLVLTHYDLAGLKEFSYTFVPGANEAAFNMDRQLFKPYCEIKSTVAASDRLRSRPPVAITAMRRENLPGSLLVRLQDREGKPAVGYVFTSDNQGLEREASSDEKGEVRFDGMMPQQESVGANLPGMKLPHFGWWAKPLPKDNELIGHWTIFAKNVDCPFGAETTIALRPAPAGYIRGALRPPAGRDIESYSIEGGSVHKNGEFLLGPYPEGKTDVTLYHWSSSSRRNVCEHKEVEVRSDRVAHIEFDETKPPHGPPGQADSCDGDAQVVDAEVSVFLPDGHAAASGAQVALLTPSDFGALEQGMTDASGRCSILATLPDYLWYTPNLEAKLDQLPDEPTFVAWIPGRFGPAVALAKSANDKGKLRIVLPPSAAQRGKITIGGKEFTEERGQLRVMAAREGTARLNALFSQYVSADPEGNFELPALAPGVYQVQAALDGIWLSESARVTVSAYAASLKPIVLKIGEPGPASTVEVVDGHGKPSPDVKVTVVRPAGPLASRLWSHAFTTDGAGVAQIPPLEAGQHIVRIEGIQGESRLFVPPLSDQKAPPGIVRATIGGPSSH